MKATGNNHRVSRRPNAATANTARPIAAATRRVLVATGDRPSTHPRPGPITAKGATVRSRYSATLPRASAVGTWKNSVPASPIATRVSAAVE